MCARARARACVCVCRAHACVRACCVRVCVQGIFVPAVCRELEEMSFTTSWRETDCQRIKGAHLWLSAPLPPSDSPGKPARARGGGIKSPFARPRARTRTRTHARDNTHARTRTHTHITLCLQRLQCNGCTARRPVMIAANNGPTKARSKGEEPSLEPSNSVHRAGTLQVRAHGPDGDGRDRRPAGTLNRPTTTPGGHCPSLNSRA